MKTIFKLTLGLLLLVFVFTSCSDNDSIVSSDTLSSKQKLEQIKSKIEIANQLSKKNESIVTYSIVFNSKKNEYDIKELEIQGGNFIPIDVNITARKVKYIVTCSGGSADGNTTECESVGCAASAVKECLDGGRCAEVCGAKMMIIPAKLKY